jgi:hypothetical protein
VELREAGLLIGQWFGIGEGKISAPGARKTPKKEIKEPELAKEGEIINPALKFSLKLDPDHPYLTERGLVREIIELFGLG